MKTKSLLVIFFIFLLVYNGFATLPAFRTEGYDIMKSKQLTVEGGSSVPVVFDWDKDGRKDLIISATAYRKVFIYFNSSDVPSNPKFDKATPLLKNGSETYFAGKFITAFISTNSDMNNDGNEDFLLCVDGKVYIYTSVTRSKSAPSINGTPISLTFGTLPFIVDHIGEDDIMPSFPSPYTSTYENSGWPVVFDYNGDGLQDILSAYLMINNYTKDPIVRIAIYTNIGTSTVPAYGTMITFLTNVPLPTAMYYEIQSAGTAYPYAFPVKWDGDAVWDIMLSYTAPSANVLPLGSYGFEWEYSLFKILKGTALGIFMGPTTLTNASNPFLPLNLGFRVSPFVCDWDNNGDLDIVSGEYMGNVHILKKVSNGSIAVNTSAGFQGVLQQTEDCDLYPGNVAGITIVDWDNDNDWDVLSSAGGGVWGNGQHYIFINHGNNDNSLYKKGEIIQNNKGANIIRSASCHSFTTFYDLNNDGLKDLIIGGEYIITPPQLVFCSNIGSDSSPVFSSVGIPIKAGGANIAMYGVVGVFYDINSDGKDDLVLSGLDSKVGYCLNLGTTDSTTGLPDYGCIEYFTVGVEKETMETRGVPSIPNVLDWDKENGTRDIVVASGSKIIYFLDTGTSSKPYYEKKEEILFERGLLNTGEYASVNIIDWNQDGYHDIFLCNTRNKIYRYMGMQLRYVSEDDSLMPKDGVYVFPNPVRGDIMNFKYLTRDDALITIEIFTLNGKLIEKIETTAYFDRINITSYSCKDFANGIYIFRITAKSYITDDEESVMKKFAILK